MGDDELTFEASDAALWESVKQTTKPLNKHVSKSLPVPKKTSPKPPDVTNVPSVVKTKDEPSPGPLNKASFRRAKRGQVEVEATLDLHGYTQKEAHQALISFVHSAFGQGKRIVLVITGKGEKNLGVLKQHVPGWLETQPCKPMVSSIQTAHIKHGGEGALYVYLRKR